MAMSDRAIAGWFALILCAAGGYVGGAALIEGGLTFAGEGRWFGLFVAGALLRAVLAGLVWPVLVTAGKALQAPRPLWDTIAGAGLGFGLAFITADASLAALARDPAPAILSTTSLALGGLVYALIARPAR